MSARPRPASSTATNSSRSTSPKIRARRPRRPSTPRSRRSSAVCATRATRAQREGAMPTSARPKGGRQEREECQCDRCGIGQGRTQRARQGRLAHVWRLAQGRQAAGEITALGFTAAHFNAPGGRLLAAGRRFSCAHRTHCSGADGGPRSVPRHAR